jgi:ParB family chromosome partitioning protein
MTDTTAPITEQDSHGTLEHLNPNDLVLEPNVRDTAAVDADFLASVTEHGVLTPISAVLEHDGTIRVRNGSLSSSRVVVDPCGAAECCRGCDRTR